MPGGAPAQRAPERRNRFRIRPAYVILVILMALFAYKFLQKTQEIRHLTAERSALQYLNQKTAADNARLQSAIAYYGTQNYVENEARAIFGYSNPGDVAIVSQPVHPRPVSVRRAPAPPAPPPQPVWKQWWDVFSR